MSGVIDPGDRMIAAGRIALPMNMRPVGDAAPFTAEQEVRILEIVRQALARHENDLAARRDRRSAT